MSMGVIGQEKVRCEITSRLNETNIDRVAIVFSGNHCENFYSILAKFSHGKRINNGQTDLWEVFQLLVAGQRSDDRIKDKIQAAAGIVSSALRNQALGKMDKNRSFDRQRKQTEKYKLRLKISQVAKVHKAALSKQTITH
ncbi:hypothetical protein ACHAWF_003815 [Thalassiosira exigua]